MKMPEFTTLPDAIALDLDGTLFNSSGEISQRNLSAIEKCIEKDIPVIFATSRPARLFHRVMPDGLAERCSWTVMNGAVVNGNHPLSGYTKHTMPENTVRGVIDIVTQQYKDIRISLEIEGHEFGTNRPEIDEARLWGINSATPDMVLSIEEAIVKQPSKIALGGIGNNTLPLMEALSEIFGDELLIVPAMMWQPMLNITNPGVSKIGALRQLLQPAGRSLENTVAFGDDYPDLDMLQNCGFGIAMGNAFDDIKDVCSYNTLSNDDDGVAVVLETILSL